jgi:hypothetical protein
MPRTAIRIGTAFMVILNSLFQFQSILCKSSYEEALSAQARTLEQSSRTAWSEPASNGCGL